jgi:hypothetical protein
MPTTGLDRSLTGGHDVGGTILDARIQDGGAGFGTRDSSGGGDPMRGGGVLVRGNGRWCKDWAEPEWIGTEAPAPGTTTGVRHDSGALRPGGHGHGAAAARGARDHRPAARVDSALHPGGGILGRGDGGGTLRQDLTRARLVHGGELFGQIV